MNVSNQTVVVPNYFHFRDGGKEERDIQTKTGTFSQLSFIIYIKPSYTGLDRLKGEYFFPFWVTK